jgi:uncharacterized protein (DUF2252 family)
MLGTQGRTHGESRALGRAQRKQVPRSSHAEWAPPPDRADPVDLLESQNVDRLPWLVPVRFGRMSPSAFTFYRGGAKIMANDLASTPDTGLTVQVCGDAHLLNFGAFGTPERTLLFDLNDFDETLPGPWEWDVKRFAASLMIAGRDNGFDKEDCRMVTRRGVQAYREAMASFVDMRAIDVWYSRLTAGDIRQLMPKKHRKTMDKRIAKARSKDSLQAFSKLAEPQGDGYRINSDPPLLHPRRELGALTGDIAGAADIEEFDTLVRQGFGNYTATLADDRRVLVKQYEIVDYAIKVVGVGSAGTRCFIVLLLGRQEGDPLFLQAKEATASVLEDCLPASKYATHGRRVVEGQRLMQAASDMFLGWSRGKTNHYYWRQLRDMKGSAAVEKFSPRVMASYARLCGWTLARAHARSGDPVAVASYMGSGNVFDRAVTEFAARYADQNEADYRQLVAAIDSGRVEAAVED